MLRDYLFAKGPPMAMIMTMSPFRVGKSPWRGHFVDGLLLGMTSKPCRWLPHDLIRRRFWIQKRSLDEFAIRIWITPSAGTSQHFWRVGAVSDHTDIRTARPCASHSVKRDGKMKNILQVDGRHGRYVRTNARWIVRTWWVVQTIPRPRHEQALRASDRRPSHLVENQAGASWDEAWYVGLPYIIVTLNHGHRSASVRGTHKNISFDQRSSVLLQSSWKLAEVREEIDGCAGIRPLDEVSVILIHLHTTKHSLVKLMWW